jgi:peptidoglycan-associated lipoprotein
MRLSLLPLSAAALLLAACSSTPDTTATTTGGDSSGQGLTSSVLPGTQADLETNVGDRVFFAFDSSTLDSAARATLDRQAQWLAQHGSLTVTIEGHADERGTREYNLALGDRRAAAASGYLSSLGVSASRIRTISYGEERPADPGHDETAWAKNRRAVTVVDVTN